MDSDLAALSAHPELVRRLDAYFRALEALGDGEALDEGLGLLPVPRAIEQTERFRTFHPLVQSLGGIVLDDAGTSAHHVVLGSAPLRGMVLYLAHDGDSRIVFDSIESFLEAAGHASRAGGDIDEQHPERSPVADDQPGLRDLMSSLLARPEGQDILPALVPSLDLTKPEFLLSLIGDDIYVAEAIGREIAVRPAPHLIPVAECCERHPHWMVRKAGAVAHARISSL